MRKFFTYSFSWILIIAVAICMTCAPSFAVNIPKRDTTNYLLPKKKAKKSLLSFALPPIRAGVTSNVRVNVPRPDDKLLSSVEVYPNPITDQINLKYILSRNSNVTIKMVDVLGNDILTLFSQRVDPGEQTRTFPIGNKLNKGFYFIRVIAGTESVIKRISIL
jgi:hypothetical protein